MRKIIICAVALCFSILSWADELEPFVCYTEGTKMITVHYDKNGNETQKDNSFIEKFIPGKDFENFTLIQKEILFDKETQKLDTLSITCNVVNGVLTMDVPKIEGVDINLGEIEELPPLNIQVGQKLPTGIKTISVSDDDSKVKLNVKVNTTKNEVIGRETITTPAGTFDCYIIEKAMIVSVLVFNEKSLTREWVCRGVGTVKQETYDYKGKKLESYSVLESFKKPQE